MCGNSGLLAPVFGVIGACLGPTSITVKHASRAVPGTARTKMSTPPVNAHAHHLCCPLTGEVEEIKPASPPPPKGPKITFVPAPPPAAASRQAPKTSAAPSSSGAAAPSTSGAAAAGGQKQEQKDLSAPVAPVAGVPAPNKIRYT